MRRVVCLIGLLCTVACGSGTNLDGPSTSIPNVAGNYSGSATFAEPERNLTLTCTATTSVTQSGATINVAPIALAAPCSLSLPVGQGTIDATGALLGSNSGTVQDTCGVYNYTGSGGFFGHDLRFSLFYVSTTCFNINFTANLTRQ